MRTATHPRVLVTGAGGFIGHHLVTALKQQGYWVRGVDTSLPDYTVGDTDEFELRDLRRFDECLLATRGIDHVYALAAGAAGHGGPRRPGALLPMGRRRRCGGAVKACPYRAGLGGRDPGLAYH
jgi:nucleoside-diphosphate-sugar epimerase